MLQAGRHINPSKVGEICIQCTLRVSTSMPFIFPGVDCDRSFERNSEIDVLRKMTSTLNVAISLQSDPVRFADAVYSAGFITEEAKYDTMSNVRNDYGKVSKVMSIVTTHIAQQLNYDEVCRKFDSFVLLLHDELTMKDLARQLVDKLRELAVCS